MAVEPKDRSFLIRLSRTEHRMLRDLAEHTGLARADVVRQLVRKEHSVMFGAAATRSKR